jgi:hypothetical protein
VADTLTAFMADTLADRKLAVQVAGARLIEASRQAATPPKSIIVA